jgi:uncharacterized damage-inducible protein DinB
MDSRCVPLEIIAELNGRLFRNCFDQVTDAVTGRRLSEVTSSFLFVACHVVDARSYLVGLVGGAADLPLVRRLRSVEKIEDLQAPPAIAELLDAWDVLAASFLRCLPRLSLQDLNRESEDRMPVNDPSVLGAITFLLQHESYHLGQLAMLKKHLTGTAMKYSARPTS